MKYSQRWKQTTIANQILSLSTALMTLDTLFLLIAAIFQYRAAQDQLRVMREQTEVTREEVRAANRAADIAADQTGAVKDSAAAAKDSATAAQTAVEQNRDLVKSAQVQAIASQVSARAAEESAKVSAQSLSVGERAYINHRRIDITKLAVGEAPTITVWFVNGGRTPASNFLFFKKIYPGEEVGRPTRAIGQIDYLDRFVRQPEPEPIGTRGKGFLLAGEEKRVVFTTDWAFTEELLSAIYSGSLKLFFEGEVDYVDSLRRRQTFRFCRVYNTKTAEFDECQE